MERSAHQTVRMFRIVEGPFFKSLKNTRNFASYLLLRMNCEMEMEMLAVLACCNTIFYTLTIGLLLLS